MTATDSRRVRRAMPQRDAEGQLIRAGDPELMVTRSFPITDIKVRSGGDGRTVDAYAAVFMDPTEIRDADGWYMEQIDPGAFTRSLKERMSQIFCVYNHAKTLAGTPSGEWSVPVGKPVEIRSDAKGLFTSTRYNTDPASERILDAIKSGSLSGMSFTGVFLRSTPELQGTYAMYEPDRDGKLTLVTRMEIALIEYGATPIPAYDSAQVVGVRAREAARDKVSLSDPADGDGFDGEGDDDDKSDAAPWGPDAARAAPAHHTAVADVTTSAWDQKNALDNMNWPAAIDQVTGQFAVYNHQNGEQEFKRSDGMFPHHEVDVDGEPGAANPIAVDDAMRRLDGEPGLPKAVKDAARAHLETHKQDEEKMMRPPASGGTGSAGRAPDDGHGRASGVDDSPWDAQKVWTAGVASDDPAAFFSATCAGRKAGDPKLASSHALPHHYHPGGPPNSHGVSAALGRFASTEGLTNSAAAKAHLEAHSRAIHSATGGDGGKGGTSSSGREPAATSATPRTGNAGAPGGSKPAVSAAPPKHPASNSSSRSPQVDGADAPTIMTIEDRVERQAEVRARLQEIDQQYTGAELPQDRRAEWVDLQNELIIHDRAIQDAQQRQAYLRSLAEQGPPEGSAEGVDNSHAGYGGDGGGYTPSRSGYTNPARGGESGPNGGSRRYGQSGPSFMTSQRDSIYDLTAIRNSARSMEEVPILYREFAMRAVEQARFPAIHGVGITRETAQERIERMLASIDDDRGTLARRILVTGSPIYDRAFGKMIGMQSVAGLSPEESRALQLGVDTYGGYAVPFQLDPTVILVSNGAINPLRQISRIEQITGKEWDGVTSTGVTVTRVAEGTEAGTGDPAFVQPHVRTQRVQGFVPFNIELDVSWGALRSQMTSLLMDAKDVEEATSFATGSGTAPAAQGIVQGVHDNGTTVSTAGTAALAIGDLYSLENNMAPRFRQQSAYLASKTTFNRFRQLFQAQASSAFDSWVRPSAGTPATFNGYPAYEQSAMTTSIASGSQVLLQGDFSQFLIVDRVGMGIELIPHLFGPTNRYPLGQRGILAIWFNNSQVLAYNAFRLLVTT